MARQPRRSAVCARDDRLEAPRAPRACRGPGAPVSADSSIAAIAWISRVVEARKASLGGEQIIEVVAALLGMRARSSSTLAGDRVEDPGLERRGLQRAVGVDPEDRGGRRLEDDAVGTDEDRLVGTARGRDSRRLHVRGVGDRLDPGEDLVRRVGDQSPPTSSRPSRGFARAPAIRRPPRVTTSRSARSSSGRSASRALISERSAPRSNSSSIAAAEPASRARWSSSAERPAAVELDHLEGTVAAQQAVVEDRDRRLRRVP